MSQKSLLQQLFDELIDLLEYGADALSDDTVRNAIITDLGGVATAGSTAPQFPPAGLHSVKAYRDAAEPNLEALFSAIQDVRTYLNALRAFAESLDLGDPDAVEDEAFRLLLDILGWNYIRLRHPHLYFIMQAVSFAEEAASVYGGEFNGPLALSVLLQRILSTLFNPCDWFEQSNFADENGLGRISDRVALGGIAAVRLIDVIGHKNLVPADDVLYGWDLVPGVPGSGTPTAVDIILARTLTLRFAGSSLRDEGTHQGNLLTTLAFLPRSQGGPGLFASLGGGYEFDGKIRKPWHLHAKFQSNGAVNLLLGKARGLEINGPGTASDFHGGLAFEARPDPGTGRAFDLSLAKGTGISAGMLRFELALVKPAVTIKTELRDGTLTIAPGLFNGFLDGLIPKNGLRLDFDFAAGVASDRGAFLEGQVRSAGTPSAPASPAGSPAATGVVPPPLPPLPRSGATGPGVSLRIPIGRSLGPLTVHDLQLRFGLEGSGENQIYLLEAGSSLSTKLGPVMARVDGLGVRLAVTFPDPPKKANLGLFDLDVGAMFPNGVALAIDVKGVVSGGGFLFHEPVQELYGGVMQLSVYERITVTAFGLLATRMPDGSKGYSLIVFITAEDFRPIPLSMGCALLGLGGMIAIHRTFSADAMREGLKNGTLGTLLFPKDPIRNAPEIIRNLAVTFPARNGSYLLGLLARIGWFSPVLVLLDMALILELGNRARLIVLGRISAKLPSRENDLVSLNMDAMGILDFDQNTAEIDAVLVDSRLAHKFVLTGSMALRARFSSGPGAGFVMAVGGFNPRFAPPPGIPKLDRVAIALSSGNNPRLTCEAYFAITSNTIQFGARAQLYAGAFGFSVEGNIGFDVLIQLVPFHFVADFHASVQLKRGSRNLFKVSVDGVLEGPRPLHVSGKASFEIFWCDFSVRFDKTLVEGEKPPLPPAVDVLAELKRAVADSQSWSTRRAANRQHGVALRKLAPGTTLVLDPLGNLMLKQQVVPLNTTREIDTFGGAPVAGARRFHIRATLNGQGQELTAVQDSFVPAQFFNMTDDEKLAGPSFEEMDAGLLFGSNTMNFDRSQTVAVPLQYETFVIDAEGQPPRPVAGPYVLTGELLLMCAGFGAVAKAPIRSAGMARFRDADAPKAAALQTARWVIASVDDTNKVAPAPPTGATWIEARAAAAALNRTAGGTAKWQLVPVHEVVS